MPFHHCLQNNYSCFSHVALGLRQRYVLWTARDAAAETADDSKLRGTAYYWNPQTRSHNGNVNVCIHITPVLFSLHWLPARQRIEFKLLLLVYRAVYYLCPVYLSSLVIPYTPTRTLRSVDQHLLTIPRYHLERYGRRAFSVAGPTLWNALPPAVRQANSIAVFKSLLKTHLFREAFRTLC